MAFHGTFEHTLDSKNRLTLPAKFRAALSGRVYLVRSEDPCISVFPASVYDALAEQETSGLNPLSVEARRKRRQMFAWADDIEIDGAGRITLAKSHLEHAGLSSGVTIAGAGESLELWDPAAWKAEEQRFALGAA